MWIRIRGVECKQWFLRNVQMVYGAHGRHAATNHHGSDVVDIQYTFAIIEYNLLR